MKLSINIYKEKLFFISDGPFLRKVINATEFEGTPLKFCNNQEFTATRRNFLEKIVEALEKRFHDFSSPTVVQASKIADFRLWPDSLESLKGLLTLLKEFGFGIQFYLFYEVAFIKMTSVISNV